MNASVSFVTDATPTATPTPTYPPATLAVTRTSFVSSCAETSTLFPATIVTFVPVLANVWTWRMVTPTVPATPTSPPAAPATTAMIESWPVAMTETLPPAVTDAESSMNASTLSVTRWTPTPTPTPAVPPIANVAATLISWYWLPAATLTSPPESITAFLPT